MYNHRTSCSRSGLHLSVVNHYTSDFSHPEQACSMSSYGSNFCSRFPAIDLSFCCSHLHELTNISPSRCCHRSTASFAEQAKHIPTSKLVLRVANSYLALQDSACNALALHRTTTWCLLYRAGGCLACCNNNVI